MRIVDVTLQDDTLCFSDGTKREATAKEKSYFRMRKKLIAYPVKIRDADGNPVFSEDGSIAEKYEIVRWADLHRHSWYSLLDGCTSIEDMVSHTEGAGAITDHGVMCGAMQFYAAMQKAEKIPIIGQEFYCETIDGEKKGNHLILLAKTEEGYKNLIKLSSMAYDNFYYKPHISYKMLEEHHEGLICSSACLGGEIPQLFLTAARNMQDAKKYTSKITEVVDWFQRVFGDDFYLEVQRHSIPDEDIVMPHLIRFARSHNIHMIATTDSHYVRKEDHEAHDVLLCIATGKTFADEKRMKFEGTGYHLHTADEVEDLFFDIPDALDNTLEIVKKCADFHITTGKYYLPRFPVPEPYKSEDEYLDALAHEGFKTRYEKFRRSKKWQIYQERLEYELSVIKKMGFAGYFLIVWDFLNYAHENNIPTGPGRGCVNAGTLIYTDHGLVPIEKISIGDKVYTHDGSLQSVRATFKYPLEEKEKLNHIRCYGDDALGNAYTDEHKIFAVKSEAVLACNNLNDVHPEWIEARNLRAGDYVVSLSDIEEKQYHNIHSPSVFVSGKYVYKQITEIQYEKTDYVYDISVKYNHSYLTSNFIAHNSGAGSIVLYCLRITDIDPMKYGLLFERFLNPSRISMPDIDSDLSERHRDDVIRYVTQRYGADHVAHIATFGTLAAKSALRDTAKVFGFTPSEAQKVSNMVPDGPKVSIQDALDQNPEFKLFAESSSTNRRIVSIAQTLEGTPRNLSTHACGIVISRDPVTEYVPELTARDSTSHEATLSTQYNMTECEDAGTLKMDFLGLRTLDVMDSALEQIKINHPDVNWTVNTIPINLPKIYKFLGSGKTDGVFQLESPGMRKLLKDMYKDVRSRSDTEEKGEEYFERLIAVVALYRPGPMDEIPNYLKAMRSGNIQYDHPKLKDILSNTYGVLVYQEQIMFAVRELAGFSAADADKVRKAMG